MNSQSSNSIATNNLLSKIIAPNHLQPTSNWIATAAEKNLFSLPFTSMFSQYLHDKPEWAISLPKIKKLTGANINHRLPVLGKFPSQSVRKGNSRCYKINIQPQLPQKSQQRP